MQTIKQERIFKLAWMRAVLMNEEEEVKITHSRYFRNAQVMSAKGEKVQHKRNEINSQLCKVGKKLVLIRQRKGTREFFPSYLPRCSLSFWFRPFFCLSFSTSFSFYSSFFTISKKSAAGPIQFHTSGRTLKSVFQKSLMFAMVEKVSFLPFPVRAKKNQ